MSDGKGKVPEGWEAVRLSMILDVLKDGTHFSPQEFGGPYKYITSKNIRFGYMDLSDIQSVSEEIHRKIYKGSPVKQGDILLTKDGANTGNVAINNLEEEFSLLSSVAILRGNKSKLENPFLFQYLLSQKMQDFIKADMSGQAITRLTLQKIGNFPILLPPLPEQRKIAAILSTWDDSLATLTNLLAAKRQQKRGLAEALLTGKKRLKGFEGEWEEKRIDDLFKEVTRFVDWDDSAIYRQAIVRRWSQGITTRDDLEGEKIKVKKLQKVKLNDFLISNIQAAYGAMAKVGDAEQGLFVSNLYTILEAREGLGDVDYFDQFSRLPQMEQLVIASSNGFKAERIRLNFDPKTFLKQKIFVPPTFSEQQAIASILSTLDGEIASLEALKAKVQEQKRGLMDELLTGRIRVRVQE